MKFSFQDLIEARKVLRQFRKTKKVKAIFYELCFCLCAPQTTFKNNIKVLESLKEYGLFYYLPLNSWQWLNVDGRTALEILLRPTRFYKQKADRIIKMMENFSEILPIIKVCPAIFTPGLAVFKRDWFVRNVKGLGYKTASHFLRNLGADDLAIIDTHILKYMKITDKKWDYIEVEKRFRKRAKRYGISVAELDAIVWKIYSKTDWSEFTH